MEISQPITDFDLTIEEVHLVHRFQYVHQFQWTTYRAGRQMDGFVLCVSGQALFRFDSHDRILEEGQMLFVAAGTAYTVTCISDKPFVHYTANFTLRRTGEPMPPMLTGSIPTTTAPENYSTYANHMEKLLSHWQGKRIGYRVMTKAILYEMLHQYCTETLRSAPGHRESRKLLPARRALDEHYMENQSVASLASLCGLSETHFRRLFHQVYGCSPTEYRQRKRILRARDLLLSGEYSIADTARETGFTDPNYFARVFRQQTGLTPSAFMKG